MTRHLPDLETPRTLLTAARRADLAILQRHWNDPLVRKYLFDDQPVDEERAASVLGACLDGAPRGHGLWLVAARDARDFIGSVALVPTSVAAEYEPRLAGLLEPMVSVVPRARGRGFAGEVLSAVLRYAFERLDVGALAAVNDVPNVASERMLLGAGFDVLGEVDGPRYRLRTYTLRRVSWSARSTSGIRRAD